MCLKKWLQKRICPVSPSPDPKEDELNNKYPKATILYTGREIPNIGVAAVDIRTFFTNNLAYELQKIDSTIGGSDDEKALSCLKWVIENITYQSDFSLFGLDEFWCFPYEVLLTRRGDCDDGAILLANLMRACGIPYWKIRLTAGLVPEGGHAYVTYYVASRDWWVALDWCYYPNLDPVGVRPDYKLSPIYMEVWFSWNSRYAFAKGVKEAETSTKTFNLRRGECIVS